MKKIISLLLAFAMVLTLAACGTAEAPETTEATEPTPPTTEAPTAEPPTEPEPELVGIAMPNANWKDDAEQMKSALEALGYQVDLQFSDDDKDIQVAQLKDMIAKGCKVLVSSSLSGDRCNELLEAAYDAEVPVVIYDGMMYDAMDPYYCSLFADENTGWIQGHYIVNALGLDTAADDQTFNIEFIGVGAGDDWAWGPWEHAMNVLQPYIDSGKLVVPSGRTDFYDCNSWNPDGMQAMFAEVLSEYYSDGTRLDAVYAPTDYVAQMVIDTLPACYSNDNYPIITGAGCSIEGVQNILAGKQAMSTIQHYPDLVAGTVVIIDSLMQGVEPPNVAETEFYVYVLGYNKTQCFNCDPRVIDNEEDIREVLINGGHYTAEELGLPPVALPTETDSPDEQFDGNVGWKLSSDGVLTFFGTGRMILSGDSSWQDYRDQILSVTIQDGVTSICDGAFADCRNLESAYIPDSVTEIGDSAFFYCSSLKKIVIPESVTSIGSNVFAECYSLSEAVLPTNMTNLEGMLFYYCRRMKSVVFPEGLPEVPGYSLSGCRSLTNVVIPESATVIKQGAFIECSRLESILIPAGIIRIEHTAFTDCTALKRIDFAGSAPDFRWNCFENVTATAYYPSDDPTWTAEVRKNYGGNITWVAK